MDKVKVRFIFLILIAFFLIGACHLQPSFATDQPANQAPVTTVSQPSSEPADLSAEECQPPESSFWPWKMLMKLDACVKKNLW